LTVAFYDKFKEIAAAADLHTDCTFTSFRHGGITESAEAGCNENEMMILRGHLHSGTVQKYAKRTRTGHEKAQLNVIALRDQELDRIAKATKTSTKALKSHKFTAAKRLGR
jgi:hypothetical protein